MSYHIDEFCRTGHSEVSKNNDRDSSVVSLSHNDNIEKTQNDNEKVAQNDSTSTYRRKDAIRDEALNEVQKIYKDENISKEDIFYYIYALLNHKGY